MFSFVVLKERSVLFDVWYLSNLLSMSNLLSSTRQQLEIIYQKNKKKKQKEIVGRSSLFGWLLDIKVW
jgi:hypothetical protein